MLFDIIKYVLAAIPVILGVLAFIRSTRGEYDKERYERLLFPTFKMLEPHLYHKVKFEDVDSPIEKVVMKVLTLIEQEQMIAGGKLKFYADYCKRNFRQNAYNNLCQQISDEYDMLCRRLGVPLRSVQYKFNRRQYRNIFDFLYLQALKLLSLFVLTLCIYALFIYCLDLLISMLVPLMQ